MQEKNSFTSFTSQAASRWWICSCWLTCHKTRNYVLKHREKEKQARKLRDRQEKESVKDANVERRSGKQVQRVAQDYGHLHCVVNIAVADFGSAKRRAIADWTGAFRRIIHDFADWDGFFFSFSFFCFLFFSFSISLFFFFWNATAYFAQFAIRGYAPAVMRLHRESLLCAVQSRALQWAEPTAKTKLRRLLHARRLTAGVEIADQPPHAAFLSPPPLAVVLHGRLIRFARPGLPPGGLVRHLHSSRGVGLLLVWWRPETSRVAPRPFPRGPGFRHLSVVQAGQRVIGFLDQVRHGQSVKARRSFG